MKIALGTGNDSNPSASLSSGSFGTSALKGVAAHNNQRSGQDDEEGVVAKKTPGEIIYRDSSTFLKVLRFAKRYNSEFN